MTIDTSTINAEYPVAGQTQTTQQFRTNFQAIKTLLEQLDQAIESLSPGTLATVATTGNYADLSNKPTLFSGDYDDLTNKPLPANAQGALVNDGTGQLSWQPQGYLGNYTVVDAQDIDTDYSVAVIDSATTATLPAPAAPQSLEGVEITLIKASANTVTTVVTVENPGWTGLGTVTLVERGETCTLINVNELWYVKSLNGVQVA